jgi:endoglucanase
MAGCSLFGSGTSRKPSTAPALSDDAKATRAATQFLSRWVDPDGRVVRRDQGNDTVSEGQGYALLLAVAVGDKGTFARVWSWTQQHLQHPNALLAYHWDNGRVIDGTPASDADVQTAWALALAGTQFHNSTYTTEARRLAVAVVTHEVGYDDQGHVTLAAGPWAVVSGLPVTVEPGYWTPPASTELAALTGDQRWASMTAADTAHLDQLTHGGTTLPPDWALLSMGVPRATGSPNRLTPVQYGLDGMRASVWNSCTVTGRSLVAREWPLLSATASQAPLARKLDGTVSNGNLTPLAAVAAAAAAQAAGQRTTSRSLLDSATSAAATFPTYYGDAWVALGRVLLTTNRLASCGS